MYRSTRAERDGDKRVSEGAQRIREDGTRDAKDVEAVMEELKGMQGRILPTEDGRKVILRAEKDRLSMLMAKQFLRIDTLEKYSGLKIEKKE